MEEQNTVDDLEWLKEYFEEKLISEENPDTLYEIKEKIGRGNFGCGKAVLFPFSFLFFTNNKKSIFGSK